MIVMANSIFDDFSIGEHVFARFESNLMGGGGMCVCPGKKKCHYINHIYVVFIVQNPANCLLHDNISDLWTYVFLYVNSKVSYWPDTFLLFTCNECALGYLL